VSIRVAGRDHEEDDMEKHAVECTFEGELISSFSDEHSTRKLYRTPEDRYLVYIDMRGSLGERAVLDGGRSGLGHSEYVARYHWPELFAAEGVL
jgi:hypothetical protein